MPFLLNPDFIIVLTAFVGNIVLGLFTYFKNPHHSTNKLFFLFTATVGLYLLINYLALHQSTDPATLALIHAVMALALIINLLFLLLATTYPYSKIQLSPALFWGAIGVTIVLVPLAFTSFIFEKVVPNTTQPVPGIGMAVFLLHTIFLLGAGLISLIKKFRTSSGVVKAQIRLLLLGTVLMFGAIITTNLIFVIVFRTTSLVGFLPLYTLVFFGFISYAIVRHRFLDIGLIVARTVAYSLVVLVIAAIYSISTLLLSRLFLSISLTNIQLSLLIGVTIIIAVSFQTIKNAIESVTDRFLFKGRYDTNEVLSTLSHIMASTLKLEKLTHEILEVLLKQMRISKVAIILIDNHQITDIKSENFIPLPEFDENEISLLENTRDTLIFDELDETEVKSVLRKLGLSVVVHLRTEGVQIGMLVLGPRQSGDIYSDQDLALLEILAPQAAVAIQNSQAYEEIRRFNITLQEEVDKATAELRDANEKLQQLDKLKDEFVSLASHELRTPMTAIKSYTWMLLNGKAPDKQQEYLQVVYDSTERLIHLVNDMLDISRIESGRVQLKPAPFDLAELADQVVNEFRPKATERQISLELQKDTSEATVNADHDKIQEVIENLLSNAVKFTPANGQVTVALSKVDNQVKLTVADTGKGIAVEDQGKLFKKFGRLDNSLTGIPTEPGTGLGLFICKQYIDLSGGKIWVESSLGQGATFAFTLPS